MQCGKVGKPQPRRLIAAKTPTVASIVPLSDSGETAAARITASLSVRHPRGTKAKPLVFTADGFAVVIGPDDAAARVGAQPQGRSTHQRKLHTLRWCGF